MPYPNGMTNADGWVMDSLGQWIHPDSADSTQIDVNSSTNVTTVTITIGANTWVQTITASTPSGSVARTVISAWVKQ